MGDKATVIQQAFTVIPAKAGIHPPSRAVRKRYWVVCPFFYIYAYVNLV